MYSKPLKGRDLASIRPPGMYKSLLGISFVCLRVSLLFSFSFFFLSIFMCECMHGYVVRVVAWRGAVRGDAGT